MNALTAVRLQRRISAPPEAVYRAWLDPALIKQWFATGENHVVDAEVDERVGGAHRAWQAAPDGTPIGGYESEIEELVPNERLVFRWGFCGPDRAAGPVYDSRLTVTFAPDGDATLLTLHHERLDTLHKTLPHVAAQIETGWNAVLDKLETVV